MTKLNIFSLVLCFIVVTSWGDEDYEYKVVATHGNWTTNTIDDVFEEVPVAWFAVAEREIEESLSTRNQRLILICDSRDESITLQAEAANFRGVLTDWWNSDETIDVSIKIDDNPSLEFDGIPDNTLVKTDDTLVLLPKLQEGERVKVRTKHGGQTHIFVASLNGFKVASEWVLDNCPVKSERDSTSMTLENVTTENPSRSGHAPKPSPTFPDTSYSIFEESKTPIFGGRMFIDAVGENDNEWGEWEYVATAMQCAADSYRETPIRAIYVKLFKDQSDDVPMASIVYTPLGGGWTGDDTDEIWTDAMILSEVHEDIFLMKDFDIPKQFINWKKLSGEERGDLKDKACRWNLDCWKGLLGTSATSKCKKLVESSAQYDHKWDGWLVEKFPNASWIDYETGAFRISGNKVKFQNGFGAWQRMSYACEYDPHKKSVKLTSIE